MNIGERIKQLLKQKGRNVESLAEQLGISKQSLYKTLNKDSFNTDTLKKIADSLGVSLAYLVDEIDIQEGFKELSYYYFLQELNSVGVFSHLEGIIARREQYPDVKSLINEVEELLIKVSPAIIYMNELRAKETLMNAIKRAHTEYIHQNKMIQDSVDIPKPNQ